MKDKFQALAVTMVALACVAGGPMRHAQPIDQRGYEPVEYFVDDLDPAARSLRELQPGLATEGGQETYIYRQRGEPEDGRLFFVTPGVVAEFDRSEYVLIEPERGERYLLHMIPPNTVFHLGLPEVEQAEPQRVDSPYRVRGRIDGRHRTPEPRGAERRGGAEAEAGPGAGAEAGAGGADWEAYARYRQAQQAAVIRAIERFSEAEADAGAAAVPGAASP